MYRFLPFLCFYPFKKNFFWQIKFCKKVCCRVKSTFFSKLEFFFFEKIRDVTNCITFLRNRKFSSHFWKIRNWNSIFHRSLTANYLTILRKAIFRDFWPPFPLVTQNHTNPHLLSMVRNASSDPLLHERYVIMWIIISYSRIFFLCKPKWKISVFKSV